MEKLVYFGKYRHFKGMEYIVIKEIELDGESVVLYRKQYGDYSYWIRPTEMFVGYKEGVKRFSFTGEVLDSKTLKGKIKVKHSETETEYEIEI